MSQDLECELSDVEIRVYNHNVFFWSLAADPPLLWALHLIVQRQQLEHQKKIFSKLTIKTLEWLYCRRSGVCIVHFEYISHITLALPLLTEFGQLNISWNVSWSLNGFPVTGNRPESMNQWFHEKTPPVMITGNSNFLRKITVKWELWFRFWKIAFLSYIVFRGTRRAGQRSTRKKVTR